MATSDTKFKYMLLSRLQSDCNYFLGNGNKSSRLWGGTVKEHIEAMRNMHNDIKVKPEWLTLDEIDDYERKMS